jgi:hypothetical protein
LRLIDANKIGGRQTIIDFETYSKMHVSFKVRVEWGVESLKMQNGEG